jgi:transposase InsO family protein
MEELFKKILYEENEGVLSAAHLYAIAKKKDPKVTKTAVRAWLDKQVVGQRFRNVKNTYMPIIGEPHYCQMDLTFIPYKGKLKPVLVVIEMTTRFVWAVVLPNKEADTVTDALANIIDEANAKKKKKRIAGIESDYGSEFINKKMQQMLERKKVELVLIQAGDKTSMGKVERMNLTLRQIVAKWVEGNGLEWLGRFQDFVDQYNQTPHRSLSEFLHHSTAPIDIKTPEQEETIRLEERANSMAYLKALNKFKVGDKVRARIMRDTFEKKSGVKWTKSIYEVGGFSGWSIVLKGSEHRYRPRDLLKVTDGEVADVEEEHPEVVAGRKEVREKRSLRKEGVDPAAIIAGPRLRARE